MVRFGVECKGEIGRDDEWMVYTELGLAVLHMLQDAGATSTSFQWSHEPTIASKSKGGRRGAAPLGA